MTTIVVVALMVNPSHSVAGKRYTPELVHEDTGRQAQQSCIQYAVAPAANVHTVLRSVAIDSI